MHVAILSQNADLAVDIRPRAEGEALAGAGHIVTLVGGTQHLSQLRDVTAQGVGLYTYSMPRPAEGNAGQVRELGQSFARAARALVQLSRVRPIDVLHSGNPPDNAWLFLRLLRRAQGYAPQFVYDQHDVAPVLADEKLGHAVHARAAVFLHERFEVASFRRAALTVFANPEYEYRARELGLLTGEHVVVPNGWRLPVGDRNGEWQSAGRPLVAYIGTINEQDCVPHLVEALTRVPRIGSIRCVVAGDGSDRRAAEQRAAELGIAGSIEWLGWVTDRRVLGSLVSAADVCVAPERDSSFNRLASFVKIVEYMSLGAPVVAHRLPQTEVLCGDSIEYADDMTPEALGRAIAAVLDDSELRARLGKRALSRFQAAIAWDHVGSPNLVSGYSSAFPNSA